MDFLGSHGFDSRQGTQMFSFSHAFDMIKIISFLSLVFTSDASRSATQARSRKKDKF